MLLANIAEEDSLALDQQENNTTQKAILLTGPPPPGWPILDETALHGLPGDLVRKLEPHTESDSAGILLQLLVMAGSVIGRGPHFKVEADRHHMNLFSVMVGESSKARKGVSSRQARDLFKDVDPKWLNERCKSGLATGQGLIWAIRDPIIKMDSKGKKKVIDHGVEDKRLFCLEEELASVLKQMSRHDSILSAILRNAWSGETLMSMTKKDPYRATDPHVSITGHITIEELQRYLTTTEIANGFGNRFLWCCVRRSKFLPDGGLSHLLDFGAETTRLQRAIESARRTEEICRDQEARETWHKVYPELSEGHPGQFGAITARAEAQVTRLACLYAVLDMSNQIRNEHLTAALAMWKYCEDSARFIFSDSLGDPVADEILAVVRKSPEGATRTEISNHFGRHHKTAVLGRALECLSTSGRIYCEKNQTPGRREERWKAVPMTSEKSEKSELTHHK